jgi:hypothetical protein
MMERTSIDTSAQLALAVDAMLSLLIDMGASLHILGQEFEKHLVNWCRGVKIRIAVADLCVFELKWITDLPFAIETNDRIQNIV